MSRKQGGELESCPCGSGQPYGDCCEPLISGVRLATTPEQLMRSRYSAYVKTAIDYLYETTHPAHRTGYDHEGTRQWAESAQWLGLEVVRSEERVFLPGRKNPLVLPPHDPVLHLFMRVRDEGRLLFIGVTDDRKVIGYAVSGDTQIAEETQALRRASKLEPFCPNLVSRGFCG